MPSPSKPSPFGEFMLERMRKVGFATRADLARRSGLSEPTLSRLLYRPDMTPDTKTLEQLAEALDLPVSTVVERWRATTAPEPLPPPADPLVAELARMLDPASPLPDEDRAALRMMLTRIAEPYRKLMRRRQR